MEMKTTFHLHYIYLRFFMSETIKRKKKFICSSCGAGYIKWMGKCIHCGEWNTITECMEYSAPKNIYLSSVSNEKQPIKLSDVRLTGQKRIPLGVTEIDRPLGGGIIPGSVILWGGEPGIGKSTLILQICSAFSKKGKLVLYCSGEESETQVKLRADRLDVNSNQCLVYGENNLERIIQEIEKNTPSMVIIDSIQTMYLPQIDSVMGSPAQIRDCTASLVRIAKEKNITVMIIGHVTKEGNISGPRILEHMVDVVFYLEGDRSHQFRILRAVKNRFGSTSESGLFVMEKNGLRGIDNPSEYLLKNNTNEKSSGSAVVPCMEGLRPILVEIQALAVHSMTAIPRRIASGYDFNRLVILLAVLEKKAKIPFSSDDVYLSVVGGYKVRETAADLSVALSLVSVKYDNPLASDMVALGEIGLTGEILPVSLIENRLKEAVKMNFRKFILPERNKKEVINFIENEQTLLLENVFFVKNIHEAIGHIK